jgi:hypothetical protein
MELKMNKHILLIKENKSIASEIISLLKGYTKKENSICENFILDYIDYFPYFSFQTTNNIDLSKVMMYLTRYNIRFVYECHFKDDRQAKSVVYNVYDINLSIDKTNPIQSNYGGKK